MTQPTAEQLELARECAETIGPFKLTYVQHENYSGEHREWNEYLNVPQGCPDIVEAAIPAIALAIQATEARMAAAVEAERERCAEMLESKAQAMLNIDPDGAQEVAEALIMAARSIRSASNG